MEGAVEQLRARIAELDKALAEAEEHRQRLIERRDKLLGSLDLLMDELSQPEPQAAETPAWMEPGEPEPTPEPPAESEPEAESKPIGVGLKREDVRKLCREAVKQLGEFTAADLARTTGLGPATVRDFIQTDCLAKDWLIEDTGQTRPHPSGRGRPARVYRYKDRVPEPKLPPRRPPTEPGTVPARSKTAQGPGGKATHLMRGIDREVQKAVQKVRHAGFKVTRDGNSHVRITTDTGQVVTVSTKDRHMDTTRQKLAKIGVKV